MIEEPDGCPALFCCLLPGLLRRRTPEKNASGVTGEENSGRITARFSAKERQWRYRRGEFRQDHGKILRKRTPVALQERRIPAGLRQDSPQKNAGGVTGEENSGKITAIAINFPKFVSIRIISYFCAISSDFRAISRE